MTNQHIEQAAQLAPIVERVHGSHHPELTRVREITEELQHADGTTHAMTLFQELRTVTEDYMIPEGVCEAFEATYHALERAEQQLTAV